MESDRRSQPRATNGGPFRPREALAARPYARPVGLFDPAYRDDGCGVAASARLDGHPAHETIPRAIETLDNLEHRGAEARTPRPATARQSSTQIPDAFLRAGWSSRCRRRASYAVAVCMLPREADRREAAETVIERLVADGGQRRPGLARRAGRRAGPRLRRHSRRCRSSASCSSGHGEGDFERRLYGIRRRAERGLGDAVYFCSFSSRTMVLKGMLGAPQLPRFYKDLCDPRFAIALAIVHSRFSTNTFPSLVARASVPLRRPQRRDQHAARECELDAGARARAGRVRRGAAGDPERRVGLAPLRLRASSCWCSRAGRSRTR